MTYSNAGKQVLLGEKVICQANDDETAAHIVRAMNDCQKIHEAMQGYNSAYVPNVENGRSKMIYTGNETEDMILDQLDALADQWLAETSIVAATHGMVAVFAKWASRELLERFRGQIEAHMHLSFVEGSVRTWDVISKQLKSKAASDSQGEQHDQ